MCKFYPPVIPTSFLPCSSFVFSVGLAAQVRAIFEEKLRSRGVALHTGISVATSAEGVLRGTAAVSGTPFELPFDECVWCTQGAAQQWMRASGFDTDAGGFLKVNTHLQSTNSPDVFGGGDCIAIEGYHRPKAGVFAVMAGMPLAINLRKRLEGQKLTDDDR